MTTKHVKVGKDADGQWFAKDRCFCGNDWPPHNKRATLGHRTAKEAVEALRRLRRESDP